MLCFEKDFMHKVQFKHDFQWSVGETKVISNRAICSKLSLLHLMLQI